MSRAALFLLAILALAAVFPTAAHEGHDHDHDHEGHDHSHEDESEAAEGSEADGDVISLTDATFEKTLAAEEIALVEFYAPWCGHCKSLAPKLEEAAKMLKESKIKIFKVDATKAQALAEKYHVQGFPTMFVFRKGQVSDKAYEGERSAEGIASYLRRQAEPAVVLLDSADKLAAFKARKGELNVVAFFSDASSEHAKQFQEAASALRDSYNFGLVSAPELLGENGNKVVLHRDFDEPVVTFGGSEVTKEALGKFLAENALPLVGEITPENAGKYVERRLPFLISFIETKNSARAEANSKLEAILRAVASEFRGKLSFLLASIETFGSQVDRLGLDKSKYPQIAIDDLVNEVNFAYTDGLDEAKLRAFVNSFVTGELKPTLKSEPVPETNNEPVKIVVGSTFKDMVIDSDKDVLMFFHAPWCGHCKSFKPKYDKVGKALASVAGVTVAKMDLTANDLPLDDKKNIQIEGFPTIALYKKSDKTKPILYNGDRSVKDVVNWVQNNAESKFTVKTGGKSASKDEL